MLQKSTFQGSKMKNCRMQTMGSHQGCERARSPRPRCPGQALMPPWSPWSPWLLQLQALCLLPLQEEKTGTPSDPQRARVLEALVILSPNYLFHHEITTQSPSSRGHRARPPEPLRTEPRAGAVVGRCSPASDRPLRLPPGPGAPSRSPRPGPGRVGVAPATL